MKPFHLVQKSMTLRTALLIYAVAPLVGALALVGYLALNSFEKEVEKQMQKDLELVARAVRLPLSYALEKDRTGSVMQALESVFSIGRVYSAYVYDEKGTEIATLGLSDPDPKPGRLTKLAAEGERRGEYGKIAGREVYSYFVPLNDTGGRIIGLLHLTRRGRDFTEHLQSIRIKGALILIGLLLTLSALVIYGHHRALGVHLRRLASSMSTVARGDRGHRFESRGPKEIAWLGANFNDMLNSIEQAEKQLDEHRRSQYELQMQLRRSEKLAALGRLAAGTAHELGTPLSVINGKAQRALRDRSISTEHRQALEAVRDEVARMEHIIRQLLNFSHSTTLRHSIAAPARLASSAVAAVDEEAKSNHTEVEIEGSAKAGPVEVDAVRVEQALINLLRNAVQSTPGGNVRISWQRDRQYITFRVDDDGPGVGNEIRSKIFEPFFTTKPVGKGTGLGLSVVQTVAEEHGGMIDVEDSESGGACFKLSLPLDPQKRSPNDTG